MPATKLYINDHLEALDLTEALSAVSPQRSEYALRYRREEDQRQCLAAYLLLQQGLKELYGIDEAPLFAWNAQGKPFLPQHPDIHFNMSHCREAAVCAIGPAPVGIDVEAIQDFDHDLLTYTMNDEEQSAIAISPHPQQAFTKLWTMKESLVKLKGEGLTDDIPHLLANTSPFHFQTLVHQRYICTLCERV